LSIKTFNNQELWNVITHGTGLVLSLIGILYLTEIAAESSIKFGIISALIFCFSLIVLYTASTVYHLACLRGQSNIHQMRIFDHISIYILIAGTYTPFSLIVLRDGNGWIIFLTIWSLALLGSLLKLFYTGKYKWLSLALYLGMGWLVIFDISDLIANSSNYTLILIFSGGAFYTIGSIVYSFKKIPYTHLLWHIFVLLGSFLHFLSVKSIFQS